MHSNYVAGSTTPSQNHGMVLGQSVIKFNSKAVPMTFPVLLNWNQPSKHDIEISKQNLDGQEIEGAKIQILKQEDKSEIDSWTSVADQSHSVSLEEGNYIFHEESAPEGYKVVTDIEFTVSEDGNVTVTKDTTTGTKTIVDGAEGSHNG